MNDISHSIRPFFLSHDHAALALQEIINRTNTTATFVFFSCNAGLISLTPCYGAKWTWHYLSVELLFIHKLKHFSYFIPFFITVVILMYHFNYCWTTKPPTTRRILHISDSYLLSQGRFDGKFVAFHLNRLYEAHCAIFRITKLSLLNRWSRWSV